MKILMIVESLRDGGKQRRLVELVRALSAKGGYSILIFMLKDDVHYREILDMDGIEVHHLHRKFRSDPRVLFSFYRMARQFNPDVVHSWGGLPSVVALPYVLLTRKPFVNGMIANSRLKLFSKEWFRIKMTFPFSDVIIANSKVGLKVYGVPKKKSLLIRNGISFDRLSFSDHSEVLLQQYGVSAKNRIVGMVATIDWRKNYPMFVRSALLLLKHRQDVTFFVVGDGPDKEALQEMIPEALRSNFVFTGKIRNVEAVIGLFEVAVLASFGEGTSNSLLEYMLMAKPVVATDVSGINEVVLEGITGFLVPQNNIESMKNKIVELLDDPAKCEQMGRMGKEQVSQNYSIHKMVSKFEAVFQNVVRG